MPKFNLLTELTLKTAGFDQGINSAKQSLTNFKSVLGGISSFLTPILGVTGGMELLKSSIEAVDSTGDAFEEFMGGIKEGFFVLQRSIATLDFSNFFENFKKAYIAGKEFARLMDELKDKIAFTDYKISALNRDKSILMETVKDKRLELSVRAAAAEEVLKIEKKIFNRRNEIAQESFDVEKKNWENRNGMAVDKAIELYEKIDSLTQSQTDELMKTFDAGVQNQLGSITQGIQSVLYGQTDPSILKKYTNDQLQNFADYYKLIKTGESDLLPKLFEASKKLQESQFSAQEDYNSSLKLTTSLLVKEEDQIDKMAKKTGKPLLESLPYSPGVNKVETARINVSDVVIDVDKYTLAPLPTPPITFLEKFKANIDEMMKEINQAVKYGMEEMIASFAEGFGELMVTGDFKEFGKKIITSLAGIMKSFGKMLIGFGIAALALKNLIKNPATAIAAGIGLIILAGAMQAAANKQNQKIQRMASGGIVSRPTLALVGEYSNARSNPEIVAPLSKLKDMLGGAGGQVTFRIDGTQLVGVLNNYNRTTNSYR